MLYSQKNQQPGQLLAGGGLLHSTAGGQLPDGVAAYRQRSMDGNRDVWDALLLQKFARPSRYAGAVKIGAGVQPNMANATLSSSAFSSTIPALVAAPSSFGFSTLASKCDNTAVASELVPCPSCGSKVPAEALHSKHLEATVRLDNTLQQPLEDLDETYAYGRHAEPSPTTMAPGTYITQHPPYSPAADTEYSGSFFSGSVGAVHQLQQHALTSDRRYLNVDQQLRSVPMGMPPLVLDNASTDAAGASPGAHGRMHHTYSVSWSSPSIHDDGESYPSSPSIITPTQHTASQGFDHLADQQQEQARLQQRQLAAARLQQQLVQLEAARAATQHLEESELLPLLMKAVADLARGRPDLLPTLLAAAVVGARPYSPKPAAAAPAATTGGNGIPRADSTNSFGYGAMSSASASPAAPWQQGVPRPFAGPEYSPLKAQPTRSRTADEAQAPGAEAGAPHVRNLLTAFQAADASPHLFGRAAGVRSGANAPAAATEAARSPEHQGDQQAADEWDSPMVPRRLDSELLAVMHTPDGEKLSADATMRRREMERAAGAAAAGEVRAAALQAAGSVQVPRSPEKDAQAAAQHYEVIHRLHEEMTTTAKSLRRMFSLVKDDSEGLSLAVAAAAAAAVATGAGGGPELQLLDDILASGAAAAGPVPAAAAAAEAPAAAQQQPVGAAADSAPAAAAADNGMSWFPRAGRGSLSGNVMLLPLVPAAPPPLRHHQRPLPGAADLAPAPSLPAAAAVSSASAFGQVVEEPEYDEEMDAGDQEEGAMAACLVRNLKLAFDAAVGLNDSSYQLDLDYAMALDLYQQGSLPYASADEGSGYASAEEGYSYAGSEAPEAAEPDVIRQLQQPQVPARMASAASIGSIAAAAPSAAAPAPAAAPEPRSLASTPAFAGRQLFASGTLLTECFTGSPAGLADSPEGAPMHGHGSWMANGAAGADADADQACSAVKTLDFGAMAEQVATEGPADQVVAAAAAAPAPPAAAGKRLLSNGSLVSMVERNESAEAEVAPNSPEKDPRAAALHLDLVHRMQEETGSAAKSLRRLFSLAKDDNSSVAVPSPAPAAAPAAAAGSPPASGTAAAASEATTPDNGEGNTFPAPPMKTLTVQRSTNPNSPAVRNLISTLEYIAATSPASSAAARARRNIPMSPASPFGWTAGSGVVTHQYEGMGSGGVPTRQGAPLRRALMQEMHAQQQPGTPSRGQRPAASGTSAASSPAPAAQQQAPGTPSRGQQLQQRNSFGARGNGRSRFANTSDAAGAAVAAATEPAIESVVSVEAGNDLAASPKSPSRMHQQMEQMRSELKQLSGLLTNISNHSAQLSSSLAAMSPARSSRSGRSTGMGDAASPTRSPVSAAGGAVMQQALPYAQMDDRQAALLAQQHQQRRQQALQEQVLLAALHQQQAAGAGFEEAADQLSLDDTHALMAGRDHMSATEALTTSSPRAVMATPDRMDELQQLDAMLDDTFEIPIQFEEQQPPRPSQASLPGGMPAVAAALQQQQLRLLANGGSQLPMGAGLYMSGNVAPWGAAEGFDEEQEQDVAGSKLTSYTLEALERTSIPASENAPPLMVERFLIENSDEVGWLPQPPSPGYTAAGDAAGAAAAAGGMLQQQLPVGASPLKRPSLGRPAVSVVVAAGAEEARVLPGAADAAADDDDYCTDEEEEDGMITPDGSPVMRGVNLLAAFEDVSVPEAEQEQGEEDNAQRSRYKSLSVQTNEQPLGSVMMLSNGGASAAPAHAAAADTYRQQSVDATAVLSPRPAAAAVASPSGAAAAAPLVFSPRMINYPDDSSSSSDYDGYDGYSSSESMRSDPDSRVWPSPPTSPSKVEGVVLPEVEEAAADDHGDEDNQNVDEAPAAAPTDGDVDGAQDYEVEDAPGHEEEGADAVAPSPFMDALQQAICNAAGPAAAGAAAGAAGGDVCAQLAGRPHSLGPELSLGVALSLASGGSPPRVNGGVAAAVAATLAGVPAEGEASGSCGNSVVEHAAVCEDAPNGDLVFTPPMRVSGYGGAGDADRAVAGAAKALEAAAAGQARASDTGSAAEGDDGVETPKLGAQRQAPEFEPTPPAVEGGDGDDGAPAVVVTPEVEPAGSSSGVSSSNKMDLPFLPQHLEHRPLPALKVNVVNLNSAMSPMMSPSSFIPTPNSCRLTTPPVRNLASPYGANSNGFRSTYLGLAPGRSPASVGPASNFSLRRHITMATNFLFDDEDGDAAAAE